MDGNSRLHVSDVHVHGAYISYLMLLLIAMFARVYWTNRCHQSHPCHHRSVSIAVDSKQISGGGMERCGRLMLAAGAEPRASVWLMSAQLSLWWRGNRRHWSFIWYLAFPSTYHSSYIPASAAACLFATLIRPREEQLYLVALSGNCIIRLAYICRHDCYVQSPVADVRCWTEDTWFGEPTSREYIGINCVSDHCLVAAVDVRVVG